MIRHTSHVVLVHSGAHNVNGMRVREVLLYSEQTVESAVSVDGDLEDP